MERMVKVTNMVNKTVGVKLPEYGINRKWVRKGQSVPIPFDALSQMLWHNGFRNMIDKGILYIDSMKDKIDLGLEEEGTKEPTNIIALNDAQILKLLKVDNFDTFKSTIDKLPEAQVRNVANYAITNKLVDVEKCNYIKDLTYIDILKSISDNNAFEKLDK